MVKRILVPLDPSPFTQTAIDLASVIAKKSDAELTGLVILDIPGIEDAIGPVPPGGLYYAEKLELAKKVEASQRVEKLLQDFKKKCETNGVKYRDAHLQGCPSSEIIKESKYYDIVMLGLRTYFNFETGGGKGESLDKILSRSITPIFGVPESFKLAEDQKNRTRATIAYDGSLLAARALQRFAQLTVPETMDITLLTSHDDRDKGKILLNKAEEYLNVHGVNNVRKEYTSQKIIDVIEDRFFEDSDVFVVGAHAKEGLFDFMVGSLTKYLVEKAIKPVFIGQ